LTRHVFTLRNFDVRQMTRTLWYGGNSNARKKAWMYFKWIVGWIEYYFFLWSWEYVIIQSLVGLWAYLCSGTIKCMYYCSGISAYLLDFPPISLEGPFLDLETKRTPYWLDLWLNGCRAESNLKWQISSQSYVFPIFFFSMKVTVYNMLVFFVFFFQRYQSRTQRINEPTITYPQHLSIHWNWFWWHLSLTHLICHSWW